MRRKVFLVAGVLFIVLSLGILSILTLLSLLGEKAELPRQEGRAILPGKGTAAPDTTQFASTGAPATDTAIDRKVVTHAQLAVTVPRLGEAQQAVLELTAALGGYVQSSNFSGQNENQSWDFTLRIPSPKAKEAVTALSALGTVDSSSSNRQDVTEEYMDLEARLAVTRQEELRLLALLQRADTIADYLQVESHLTRVRIEIEQTTGRIKFLTHSVDLASISLRLSAERGTIIPKPVGFAGLGQRLSAAYRQGLNIVVGIISGVLVFLVTLSPLLVLLLPFFLFGIIYYRRLSRKQKPPLE